MRRDDLDAILRARSGSLADTPYPLLLLALDLGERSAVLALRRNQLEKTIVFDAGSPVECRSNIATETLGRFLVAQGKLSEEHYRAAMSVAAARGVPIAEVLTERKLLAATELYRALQQNLGRQLLEPFSWTTGTWEISYDVPPTASALRVKVPQLLVTGILKVEAQERVDAAVAVAEGKYLALAAEPLVALDELRLTPDQQKVVDAARAGNALASLRDLDPDDRNRIVYALLLLGIIEVTAQPRRTAPVFELDLPQGMGDGRLGMADTPSPITHPPSPAPRRRVDPAVAEEIMAAYLGYRRKDPFELLGVSESDGAMAFIRAFLAMSEKFLPSRFDDGDPIRDKAQEVFLAAARAYAELADPDRRAALVKRRAALVEVQREAAVAAEAPAAAVIDPEELCKTGRNLAAAGKLREALSSFEMAAECDAQNGTYAAEAAWCRFQLRGSPASTVMTMLKNAMRIDPGAGTAYLYAGRVQTILGNKVEAEAYLNRAAMLMPRDMRVVEALRALR